MSEDLYQKQIVEWSKKTDHCVRLNEVHCRATVNNPLCGDKIAVELQLDGEVIKMLSYQVKGCLLCKASGAILAELAEGITFDKIEKMNADLSGALASSTDDSRTFPEEFRLFFPVRLHKSRHSCVLLPFNAVAKAISEFRNSSVKEG